MQFMCRVLRAYGTHPIHRLRLLSVPHELSWENGGRIRDNRRILEAGFNGWHIFVDLYQISKR